MNSRAIALGASVIALAFTAAPAHAGSLDGLPQLPETDVAAKVEVKANVPVTVPAKSPLGGSRRHGGTEAGLKAKSEAGTDRGGAHFGWNGRADTPAGSIGGHGGVEQDVRLKATPKRGLDERASTRAYGSVQAAGDLGRRGHASAKTKVKGRASHAAKARPGLKTNRLAPKGVGHSKPKVPLQGIGREVGNPIQLSLAGWLIALAAAGCLGVSRLARRLHRSH